MRGQSGRSSREKEDGSRLVLGLWGVGAYRGGPGSGGVSLRAVMRRHAPEDDDYKHGYQNTVFRVRDDQGALVEDYLIELYDIRIDRHQRPEVFRLSEQSP